MVRSLELPPGLIRMLTLCMCVNVCVFEITFDGLVLAGTIQVHYTNINKLC